MPTGLFIYLPRMPPEFDPVSLANRQHEALTQENLGNSAWPRVVN